MAIHENESRLNICVSSILLNPILPRKLVVSITIGKIASNRSQNVRPSALSRTHWAPNSARNCDVAAHSEMPARVGRVSGCVIALRIHRSASPADAAQNIPPFSRAANLKEITFHGEKRLQKRFHFRKILSLSLCEMSYRVTLHHQQLNF